MIDSAPTPLPFPSPPSLDEAVQLHVDVVEDIRSLKESVERNATDLAALQHQLDRIETDAHRGLNASTAACGRVMHLEKKIAALHADIRRLLERGSNGHG